jgi:hypothetical protein
MSALACNEFLNRLEQWMEGERPSETRAHVRDCSRCRTLVGDLATIQHTAQALAIDAEPSPEVWQSLRAQLVEEDLIHTGGRGWVPAVAGWLSETFALVPRPALAGAYLVALITIGVALSGPAGHHSNEAQWITGTESSTQPLRAQLATAELDTVSSLRETDPVVTASLHDNLAIVDNYIALCEKSVREDPENEVARDYLYGAYEQKADLLAQMSERGDDGQ